MLVITTYRHLIGLLVLLHKDWDLSIAFLVVYVSHNILIILIWVQLLSGLLFLDLFIIGILKHVFHIWLLVFLIFIQLIRGIALLLYLIIGHENRLVIIWIVSLAWLNFSCFKWPAIAVKLLVLFPFKSKVALSFLSHTMINIRYLHIFIDAYDVWYLSIAIILSMHDLRGNWIWVSSFLIVGEQPLIHWILTNGLN